MELWKRRLFLVSIFLLLLAVGSLSAKLIKKSNKASLAAKSKATPGTLNTLEGNSKNKQVNNELNAIDDDDDDLDEYDEEDDDRDPDDDNDEDGDDDDDDDDDWNSDEDDFEFDESKKDGNTGRKSLEDTFKHVYEAWTVDDLCKDVQCRSGQTCIIVRQGVAQCVNNEPSRGKAKSKPKEKDPGPAITNIIDIDVDQNVMKELKYYWDDPKTTDKKCSPCPVVRPDFVCGDDNSTYSSLCRLEFHNCVHETEVKVQCKGFCPCPVPSSFPSDVTTSDGTRMRPLPLTKSAAKLKEKEKLKMKWEKHTNVLKNRINVEQQSLTRKEQPIPICNDAQMQSMGSRLVDWFSVLKSDQKSKKKVSKSKAKQLLKLKTDVNMPECREQVIWMFSHLDTDNDEKLSLKELYYLERDEYEACLKPYLDTCDEDRDGYLSPYEWCSCFTVEHRPCLASRKTNARKRGLVGGYMPQCDENGFFKALQCHSGTGMCWCVDRMGSEFANTKRKGKPDCEGLINRAQQRSQYHNHEVLDSDEDDNVDDEDDDLGSGEGQL